MTHEEKKNEQEKPTPMQTLQSAFAKRSDLLEVVLRTGKISTENGALDVKATLDTPGWKRTLLEAIRFACQPDGKRSVQASNHVEPYDSSVGRTTDYLVRRFVQQHLMHRLLEQCSKAFANKRPEASASATATATGAPGGPGTVSDPKGFAQEIFKTWSSAIPGEILAFYDATVVELLSRRSLPGEVGARSFFDSVREARGVHRVTHPPKTTKLPAQKQIQSVLASYFYSDSAGSNPYWHLLQNGASVLQAVNEVIHRGHPLVNWSLGLFDAAAELEPHLKLGVDASVEPTGGNDWFFEPGRVIAFIDAAEGALRKKDDIGDESDDKNADALERARESFTEALMEEKPDAGAGQPGRHVPHPHGELSKSYFQKMMEIERLWWRSFGWGDAGRPRKLAEWSGRPFKEEASPRNELCHEVVHVRSCNAPTQRPNRRIVVVFGAGIAGLTAAQELAERNFEVHVVEVAGPVRERGERAEDSVQVGGLARTQWAQLRPARRVDPKPNGPGEHGYRLFPSFYRHVFDTMKRTPIDAPRPGTRPTAFDQLEPTFQQIFARRDRVVPLGRTRPRTLEAFRREYMSLTQGLEFTRRDLARFFFKIVRYMMTCSARRAAEYERVSLVKFLGADQPGFYSDRFVKAVKAAPQALVAMDAERCDARTQGNVYVQLLIDQVLGGPYTDSVLSGPTSTAWLVPWRRHLQTNLDVTFHRGELLSITGNDGHGEHRINACIAVPKTVAWPAQRAAETASETAKKAAETAQNAAETCKKAAETHAKTQAVQNAGATALQVGEAAQKAAEIAKNAAEIAKNAAETAKQATEAMKGAAEAAQKAAERAKNVAETDQKIPSEQRALPREAHYFVVALDVVAAERVTRSWDAPGTRGNPHDGVPRDLRGYTSYVETTLPPRLNRYEIAITYTRPMRAHQLEDKLLSLLYRVRAAKEDPSLDASAKSVFGSVSYFTGLVVPARDDFGQPLPEGDGVSEIRLHFWFKDKVGPDEVRMILTVIRRWTNRDIPVRLIGFTPESFEDGQKIKTPRVPQERYGDYPDDRLQTFTGVQFYFEQDFKLVRGHVYFPDTDWGLSAVSQSQFWVQHFFPRAPGERTSIRGILSVDIGNCRRPSSYTGKSVMSSSPDEIQKEVWRQIQDSLRTARGPAAPITNLPLPQPDYYHLDTNLVFSGGALRANKTPFLINNVGDWEKRPRCMPWVPGGSKLGDGCPTDGTGLWQAPQGGYRVHEDHVVFCGSYMRTFTRMTTMESANESARHAVNAILDHCASTFGTADLADSGITGDYCDIWDIEEQELEDLAFFKRVDEMLFKAGKPHIADILQFDKIADLQHPEPTAGQSLLAALGATIGKDWGVEPNEIAGGANGLMEILKSAGKDYGGLGNLLALAGGGESNLQKLFSILGLGKGFAGHKE